MRTILSAYAKQKCSAEQHFIIGLHLRANKKVPSSTVRRLRRQSDYRTALRKPNFFGNLSDRIYLFVLTILLFSTDEVKCSDAMTVSGVDER